MTYTGDVEVGGPADTRELDGVTLTKIAVGDFNNNSYLLRCQATGQALLIDAAAEPDRLLQMIGDTPVAKIVTTHQHGDHWQALAEVKKATGAVTVAHPKDAPGIPVATDELVEDGGTVEFGNVSLEVTHLVGHTPGSIALTYRSGGDPHVFTGDCLFPGGVGNTQKDAARFQTLFEGVRDKVFGRLPDSTWVYPGHGSDTTLGAERPHLNEWRERGW
ncbi:MAG: MBL fold metallo-hydrolase [Streptosporangiales bacterium]|nr:MBL fold metallo-hydrolase [Streptosporangiales bacterium]